VSYADKVALFRAAADELGEPRVSRAIGETVLKERVGLGVRLVLRALGSPNRVLEQVSRTAPKFSTACTMETSGTANDQATVTYRLAAGLTPDAFDCDYNIGLLSQVTVLFGLPAARVEHEICQVHGADRCVYLVSWKPRRFGRRRAQLALLADEQRTREERAAVVQASTADLVAAADLDRSLAQIGARASGAVGATGYVVGVRARGSDELRVSSSGIGPFRAERLAQRLLAGEPADGDERLLVAPIGAYGVLVAVPARGQEFFAEEQPLLAEYAERVAALLDSYAGEPADDPVTECAC
jgi:hypothetical protein